MRNLINITDDYLSKSTDFAIQIVGNWGHGKTYYYRNTLEDFIYRKSTNEDASRKYKPIYVSLFGLKSVADIATKIVSDFYESKIFQNYVKKTLVKKRLKITHGVLKIGLRGFLNFQRLGNVNDYLTDIKAIGENVLDTNELVICFDDLERKDSSLKIEDLTGYINSLVDEGIKVLLISNENLLLGKDDEYKNLKEKIIGITVEYVPDIKETIGDIIRTRYVAFPVYTEFLTQNLEDLTRLSQATNCNFRHVIYALDSIHHCHSKIRNSIIDTNHEIKDKVLQEIRKLSFLIFALAVEYKSSTIKYSDLAFYRDDNIFFHALLAEGSRADTEKKSEPENKLQSLMNKYGILKEDYHLFETIYNYITGYDEFSISEFISEFKKKFNLEKGNVLPQYQELHSLSYPNCFYLTDQQYREKTFKIIDYAKSGLYAAVDYLSVMHCAERMDNLLELDLREVKNVLVVGLKNSISSRPFNHLEKSQFKLSGRTSKISEINKQLYEEGLAFFNQFEKEQVKHKVEAIANMLLNDINEFQIRFRNDQNFINQLAQHAFLSYLEPEALLQKIKTTDNQTIIFLRHFFEERYADVQKLNQEFQTIGRLSELIIEYKDHLVTDPNQKIRTHVVSDLALLLAKLKEKVENSSNDRN